MTDMIINKYIEGSMIILTK